MNSRVHPNFKTKYKVTNWADDGRALVDRGNIILWITPAAIKAWKAKASGKRGAPRKYSDLAIETALTLRLVFRLPLRQAEGFLRSLLDMMDLSLEAPDHTTLSIRSRELDVTLENAFFRYKSMLGDRLHARDRRSQEVEVAIGCKVLNRMLVLGSPKSKAVGR